MKQEDSSVRQINLGFTIQDIMKSHSNFKMLYNNKELKCCLLYDGKSIYEFNYHKMIETAKKNLSDFNETKLAVKATYCQKYDIYLMLFEGYKLYIFRRNLVLLQKVNFDSKYSVGFHYIDRFDQLLLIGVDVIDLISLDVKTNIQKVKYLKNITFDLAKIKKTTFEEGLEWNKGFYITEGDYESDNLIYIWGFKDLKVLKLFNGKPVLIFQGLGRKENVISCFLLLPSYRYFVIGYQNGQMKVWKLTQGKNIIHTFDGHLRQVDSMVQHVDQRFFWSSSGDQTIRLWNLDQFINVYVFQLSGVFTEITLISYDKFIAEHDQMICLGTSINCKNLIYTHGSNVYHGLKQYENGFGSAPRALVLALDNNSGLCIWSESFQNGSNFDQNNVQYKSIIIKIPIGVFYSPPKSKGVLQILPSPYDYDEFLIMFEGGDICLSKMERGTGVMLSYQKSEKIQDFEGHDISQTASVVNFLNLEVPLFDVDFGRQKEGGASTGQKTLAFLAKVDNEGDKKIFAIGLSKGSVIFVSLKNMTTIHTRISYHRDPILSLQGCYEKKNDIKQKYLLSLCVKGILKMVVFNNYKSECIKTIECNQSIFTLLNMQNKLITITKKGWFQIFKLKQQEFRTYSNDQGNEHDLPILNIDYSIENKIIITSSQDQKIKLWTWRKILLMQISVNDNLQGAWLINNRPDIIVTHDGKISLVDEKYLKLSIQNIKQQNASYKQSRLKGLTIEEFYQQLQFKLNSNYIMSQRQQKYVKFEEIQDYSEQKRKTSLSQNIFKAESNEEKDAKSPENYSKPYQSNLSEFGRIKGKKKNFYNYVGGKILFPNINDPEHSKKQIIIVRGNPNDEQQPNDEQIQYKRSKTFHSQPPQINKMKKKEDQNFSMSQNKYSEDWEIYEEYEKNKQQRTALLPALPKENQNFLELLEMSFQKDNRSRRVMTRRDITYNRILLQHLIDSSEQKQSKSNS